MTIAGIPMKTKHNPATMSVQKKRIRDPKPGRVASVLVGVEFTGWSVADMNPRVAADSTRRQCYASDDGAVSNDRPLGYDDDSIANEVVLAVMMVAAGLIEYANV